MPAIQRRSTWLFLIILLLSWGAIHLDVAPAAVDQNAADTAFHVSNAFTWLQPIAREPHPMGTAANDSVRNYIVSACRRLNLDVEQRPWQLSVRFYGMLAAQGINIAATLHGTSGANRKKILVMGHYDSEPNALGAGDDGSACAAMLESARALQAGTPLPCDVIFLFTNGEEEGLLGAEAFSRDSAQWKDIGLVLNFDGRGDAGKCLMFRTSADNRWIIDEYARASVHHGAGSLYSELFKLLPNNTDFTPLQKTHIPGLDYAFAEGFIHYHNLTDDVDNIDKDMMQDQGDNMLGSIRHFAQLDLGSPSVNTPNTNTTYFDLLGNLLIHYSSSVNFVLLLLTNALVVLALVLGFKKKQIKLRHAALGLLLFPITLVVLYFLAGWTLDAIRAAWPLYLGYYPNSYNAYYFYLVMAAEALAVFTLIYQWPLRNWSAQSLLIAVLVFQTVVLDLVYHFIPAGVYFLYFPLIGSALLFSRQSLPALFLGALLPVLFLAPLIYSLAELFDIQNEAALVAPVTGLLLGLLIPIFSPSIRENRWLITRAAWIVFFAAIGLGCIHGSYSPGKPLKTDLRYFVQTNEHTAWWVSHSKTADRWNKTFFAQGNLKPNAYQYPHPFPDVTRELFSPARVLDLAAPVLTMTKDTVVDGHRLLYLHCQPEKGTTSVHFNFTHDEPADSLVIVAGHYPGPIEDLDYLAPSSDGFDVMISCKSGKPFLIDVTARTMGIPANVGFTGYPAGVIPAPAYWANTTWVQRSFSF